MAKKKADIKKIVSKLGISELAELEKEARREKARKKREAKNKKLMEIAQVCVKQKKVLLELDIPDDLKKLLREV